TEQAEVPVKKTLQSDGYAGIRREDQSRQQRGKTTGRKPSVGICLTGGGGSRNSSFAFNHLRSISQNRAGTQGKFLSSDQSDPVCSRAFPPALLAGCFRQRNQATLQ